MGSGHTKIRPVNNNAVNFTDEYTRRQMEGKLFNVINQKKFRLARILIDGGINVNCSLRTGITPLMVACDQRVDKEWERMQRHLIRILLVNNADVNAKDNLGRTSRMYATLTGDIQLVRLLEVHGSSAVENDTIFTSRVPRHSAVISSNLGTHFHHWDSIDFQDAMI
jgi:hypothetical protein